MSELSDKDELYMGLIAAAASMKQFYDSYIDVGFTERQAMELVINMCIIGPMAEASKAKKKDE